MATANLKAVISLNTSSFTKGLAAMQSRLAAVGSAMTGTAARITAAIGGIVSVGAFVKGIDGALEMGAALQNLSARTGAPIKDLMLLQQIFKEAGVGAESVGPAINRMQKALTGTNERGEPTNKMFEKLGLNMESLRKLTPAGQFEAVGKAIAALPDPAERAAAAMGIFGKSGGDLLAIFRDPEALAKAGKVIGSQADIFARNAATFKELADSFHSIGTKFQGFFAGMAESLLPTLKRLADFIVGLDLAPMGKKLGDSIQQGLTVLENAFKAGGLGDLVEMGLMAAFATAGDYLIKTLIAAVNTLAVELEALFSSRHLFDGLFLMFAAIGEKIKGVLAQAFKSPIEELQKNKAFELAKKSDTSLETLNNFKSELNASQKGEQLPMNKNLLALLGLGGADKKAIFGALNEAKGGNKDWMEKLIERAQNKIEDQILAEIEKNQPSNKDAEKFNAKAEEYFAAAGVDFVALVKSLPNGLKVMSEEWAKAAGNALGSSEMRDEFMALWKKYGSKKGNGGWDPSDELLAQSKMWGRKDQGLESITKMKPIESDRLARIGGFLGGGGAANAALGYARKSAQHLFNIEKNTIHLRDRPPNAVGVWG